jgi:HEAT repeat protein
MPKKIPFNQLVAALLDNNTVFPPQYLRRFNDLEKSEIKTLAAAWPKINPTRRRTLLEDLEELVDADPLILIDADLAKLGLEDPEPGVRQVAIRIMWENPDLSLVPFLLSTVEKDPSPEVRAEAASSLGNYIYLGELEEINAKIHHQIEDMLLKVTQGSDTPLVRQRALEALGFSSREEVHVLIQKAYDSRDAEWTSSALFAMGRSYNPVWEPAVRREMRSPHAKVQLEAVRAAGELNLENARRALLDLLEDESTDSEIRAATIWSLSQIGGEEVRETLEKLQEEIDDEEELELLETALENLTLTEQVQPALDFFNIDLANKDHYTGIVDLEKELPSDSLLPDDLLLDEDDDEGEDDGEIDLDSLDEDDPDDDAARDDQLD